MEILNITEIKEYMQSASTSEALAMGLNAYQVSQIQNDISTIYHLNLGTLMNIDRYMKAQMTASEIEALNKRAENTFNSGRVTAMTKQETVEVTDMTTGVHHGVKHVGVDIGSHKFVTCSNPDMDRYFIHKESRIPQLVSGLGRKLNSNQTQRVRDFERQTFNARVRPFIITAVYRIQRMYPDMEVLAIGEMPSGTISPEMRALMHEFKKVTTEMLSGKRIKVVSTKENATSITCPNCGSMKRGNRTSDNRFDCKDCEFSHDIDDVVAAGTIIGRYLSASRRMY